MSYDVSLRKCGQAIKVPLFSEGGTYAIGGSDEAWLNITYNYGRHIREALGFNLGRLDGMTAQAALPYLRKAVLRLGKERDEDYWAAKPGNAGYALSILLAWAEQAVVQGEGDAVFEVS